VLTPKREPNIYQSIDGGAANEQRTVSLLRLLVGTATRLVRRDEDASLEKRKLFASVNALFDNRIGRKRNVDGGGPCGPPLLGERSMRHSDGHVF
jgi:hypothetical protein